MTQLFTNAVKLLKETGRADARRAHVVEVSCETSTRRDKR
jgi:hypothetical protein